MLRQHEIEIRVRYQETDAMGFLHHANFLTYFEIGRTELMRADGFDYRRFEEELGLYIVVVSVECRYLKPARYDDLLKLQTEIHDVSRVRIRHRYRLLRGNEILAKGESALACVDGQGKLQGLPDVLMPSDDGEP